MNKGTWVLQKYWSVDFKGFSIGTKPLKVNATNAVFDSGTHFIIASDADARIINGVSLTCLPFSFFGILHFAVHQSYSCVFPELRKSSSVGLQASPTVSFKVTIPPSSASERAAQ